MLRVARSLLYDAQESEDVVSDIFESLLRGKVALNPGAERLRVGEVRQAARQRRALAWNATC